MAMFEQMRANVGKLLKGIDRSEPDRRDRSGPAGRRRGFPPTARGGRGARACPGMGFSVTVYGRRSSWRRTGLRREHGKGLEARERLPFGFCN